MEEQGWDLRRIRAELRDVRSQDWHFGDGGILGSMCTEPHDIAREAYAQFLETNLGDPGHFPGTARLETEVLEDLLNLTNAPKRAAARLLGGGTEANLLAMYVARELTGRREVVLPTSAHFSFEKAARMLEMDTVWVDTTASGHADPEAMAAAIGPDTALMVGIAGTTELGLIDPIRALAKLAKETDTLLHVDAAFGGYVIPFLEEAGRKPHVTDFRLPGVWSLAMDPHKMGMAPIPSGVLILRNGAAWKSIAVPTPYVSTDSQSSIAGTRPGAAAASVWAVHKHLGRLGYASIVEQCLDNAAYLAAQLQSRGFSLVAQPELNVVTFHVQHPTEMQETWAAQGFRVNVIPRMGAVRIVVNPHVTRAVLDRFLQCLDGQA